MIKLKFNFCSIYLYTQNEQNDHTEIHFGPNILVHCIFYMIEIRNILVG